MSEFLLVVEGLMAGGADAAMLVSEDTYKGAMFGCIFDEPVHGYVWCDRHDWVLADEACVCGDCVEAAWEAEYERMCEIEERAWLHTERAAEWAVQQFVNQLPCSDPDPYDGLTPDQYFHAMNMSEQLGMDWDEACAIARGDL
jgi:hypothetical protein